MCKRLHYEQTKSRGSDDQRLLKITTAETKTGVLLIETQKDDHLDQLRAAGGHFYLSGNPVDWQKSADFD